MRIRDEIQTPLRGWLGSGEKSWSDHPVNSNSNSPGNVRRYRASIPKVPLPARGVEKMDWISHLLWIALALGGRASGTAGLRESRSHRAAQPAMDKLHILQVTILVRSLHSDTVHQCGPLVNLAAGLLRLRPTTLTTSASVSCHTRQDVCRDIRKAEQSLDEVYSLESARACTYWAEKCLTLCAYPLPPALPSLLLLRWDGYSLHSPATSRTYSVVVERGNSLPLPVARSGVTGCRRDPWDEAANVTAKRKWFEAADVGEGRTRWRHKKMEAEFQSRKERSYRLQNPTTGFATGRRCFQLLHLPPVALISCTLPSNRLQPVARFLVLVKCFVPSSHYHRRYFLSFLIHSFARCFLRIHILPASAILVVGNRFSFYFNSRLALRFFRQTRWIFPFSEWFFLPRIESARSQGNGTRYVRLHPYTLNWRWRRWADGERRCCPIGSVQ